MKVLILAYYYPPQNAAGATRPLRFAKYLPKFGYDVAVVSANSRGGGLIAKLAECILWFFRVFNSFDKRITWVPHALSVSRQVFSEGPVAAMISTAPPFSCHLAALYLKRRYGIRWVADFRDPLVGNAVRRSSPYDSIIERLIFKYADVVVANTETVAQMWHERHPGQTSKIAVVPNGFDPEEEFPRVPTARRDYKIIAHVGDLYGGRDPGALLSSLERLFARGLLETRKLRIRLIGPIDLDSSLQRLPAFASMQNRGCLEYNATLVSRAESLAAMVDADYLLLLDFNFHAQDTGLHVPVKLFDYLRSGRPIIAFTAPSSPAVSILERTGVPFISLNSLNSEADVDARVLQFLSRSQGAVAPNEWFRREFNGVSQVDKLASLLRG
jgi:glycosyltransferase involved in cell wall biosynthesis